MHTPKRLVLGVSLLLLAASSFAGSASGQFSVQITLNNPRDTTGSNVCVSATGTGANNGSVQVRCSNDVFVDIAQVRYMPTFRPNRDTLLPDFCRNEQTGMSQRLTTRTVCRLDDDQRFSGSGEDGEGWQLGDSLFAMDSEAEAKQQQARLHDDRGTLTSLRIASGSAGLVEMLVSF